MEYGTCTFITALPAGRDGEGTTPSTDEVTEDIPTVPGHRGGGDEYLLYFVGALDQVLPAILLG